VLVEADLRRPTLASLFGLRESPGLVDILVGAATLDDALAAVPNHHLFVLPAGMAAARSTELLASAAMQRILDALRARFDRIVIDTPPVAVADTHVLSRTADGILLVVRAGVTPRPAIERALEGMEREKVLGMVLNEVEETNGAYDYRYAYPGPQERADGE
jgi:capsular exopolysaccharide synthesis family protein